MRTHTIFFDSHSILEIVQNFTLGMAPMFLSFWLWRSVILLSSQLCKHLIPSMFQSLW